MVVHLTCEHDRTSFVTIPLPVIFVHFDSPIIQLKQTTLTPSAYNTVTTPTSNTRWPVSQYSSPCLDFLIFFVVFEKPAHNFPSQLNLFITTWLLKPREKHKTEPKHKSYRHRNTHLPILTATDPKKKMKKKYFNREREKQRKFQSTEEKKMTEREREREMGEMYECDKNACSSSASVAQPVAAPDEISLFLQQILVRSSTSSSDYSTSVTARAGMRSQFSLSTPPSIMGFCTSNGLPDNLNGQCGPQFLGEGISAVDTSGAYFLGSASGNAPNVSSSSLGASENENDEYDCESEVL